MDELKLLYEFEDRHADYLIYEGDYQLAQSIDESVKKLFQDWRQRVYRFEHDLGASVVLYQPMYQQCMTWDLVLTRFFGEAPFEFIRLNVLRTNLHWRDVQKVLDKIKTNTL